MKIVRLWVELTVTDDTPLDEMRDAATALAEGLAESDAFPDLSDWRATVIDSGVSFA